MPGFAEQRREHADGSLGFRLAEKEIPQGAHG